MRMLSILLDAGANVSVKDNFGRTPLLEAVRANNHPTAMLLWEKGAVLGLVDADDPGAKASDLLAGGEMCTAAFGGKLDYLRMLLQFGVVRAAGCLLVVAPWCYTCAARLPDVSSRTIIITEHPPDRVLLALG